MPPSSAFKVYIRENGETIEVVTPAKSEAEKVPLGFEKRDRIPRTPVKDEDGNSIIDSVIHTPLSVEKIGSNPFESFSVPDAPIQRIDRNKKPWWCWRQMCIIS